MDKREPQIEALLNAARDVGVQSLEGLPATRANLDRLAYIARQTVIAQVATGMWRPWADAGELDELRCTVELNAPGLVVATAGAARVPISLRWDFTRTSLRFLETQCV